MDKLVVLFSRIWAHRQTAEHARHRCRKSTDIWSAKTCERLASGEISRSVVLLQFSQVRSELQGL